MLADKLALEVYSKTKTFSKDEIFGLRSQIRRAAVSIASNIVEGCGRDSEKDFCRFLEIAHGSALELQYQFSLTFRLDMINKTDYHVLKDLSMQTSKCINALRTSIKKNLKPES